jgi:hypothetical protein
VKGGINGRRYANGQRIDANEELQRAIASLRQATEHPREASQERHNAKAPLLHAIEMPRHATASLQYTIAVPREANDSPLKAVFTLVDGLRRSV